MRSELLFDASCSITARASAAAKRAQRAERVGLMRVLDGCIFLSQPLNDFCAESLCFQEFCCADSFLSDVA